LKKTLKEIAALVDGELVGDENIVITGVCGIKEAKQGDIAFLANSRYSSLMNITKASCVITSKDVQNSPRPIIRTESPSLAFAKIVSTFSPQNVRRPKGIAQTAVIGNKVKLGKDVAIQPYAIIEDDVEIGDRTIIYGGAYIGYKTKVGSDCIIYPNVTIREDLIIGNRVIIHPGTAIGSDGFGFATVKGVHHKIPQIGTVVIEDDVEIGSNVSIDRARFGETRIHKGTKIDNLVQIAHNVEIGEGSIIIAQAGISGSTKVGKGATLAGQAGIVGHITIGENAIVGAQGGVTKSVAPNTFVSGYPARPHHIAKRINACIQRLPILFKIVSGLSKRLQEVEKASGITTHTEKDDKS
jgi:UDP-3-O-[3-hydroxymyristoyl] glucosamine N-acyltransferase